MSRVAARRVISSYVEVPVATFLARLGLSPNSITLAGLLVAGASAYLLSIGYLWAGGVVLLASGVFDLFDGALARVTNRVSRFGALLDSVSDRVSEAAVLYMRESERAKKYVARLESKHGKGKAISILSAKMGRAVYFMLRRREAFDEERFFAAA